MNINQFNYTNEDKKDLGELIHFEKLDDIGMCRMLTFIMFI